MDNVVSTGKIILGKYRVERVLGQGGMGVVVAARHIELGELFAIKFLLPEMLGHNELVERFIREARAAAHLRTEHVARVHDVGRLETGAPYMVMEYLDGSDLKMLVRNNGPLPVADVLEYLLQVCEAIAEAHAAGIVHRDLKPANLFLIKRPSGKPCVKVLDFGISKQMQGEQVDLTGACGMLGSPSYMSPEQMLQSRAVEARTDIWALGVILYELLLGQLPFKGQTVPEMVASVLSATPPSPGKLRSDLPRALESVIFRCLKKRPDERFGNIDELADALRSIPSVSQLSSVVNTIPFQKMDSAPNLTISAGGASGVHVVSSPSMSTFIATPRRSRFIVPVTIGIIGLAGSATWFAVRSSLNPSPNLEAVPASSFVAPMIGSSSTTDQYMGATPSVTPVMAQSVTKSSATPASPTRNYAPVAAPAHKPTATPVHETIY